MTATLYTIPAAQPFLATLAQAILRRSLAPLSDPSQKPALILLPSQRACRGLKQALLHQAPGGLLLPHIRGLGDSTSLLHMPDPTLLKAIQKIPPAISRFKRQAVLTNMLLEHHQKESRLPLTHEQAGYLAHDLTQFLDDLQAHDCSTDILASIIPEELAEHWQITLDVLQRTLTSWEAYLEEQGCMDPETYHTHITLLCAEHWANRPPEHPILAAGSTGTHPATATLLATIAHLPRGAVILQGALPPAASKQPLPPQHPQYATQQCLEHIGVTAEQALPWPEPAAPLAPKAREALWQQVFALKKPSNPTLQNPNDLEQACGNLSCIEAEHPEEEARIISLILRHSLEKTNHTAALVTTNRQLALRVKAQMQRWNLDINDSAGTPLAKTTPVVFLQLLCEAVATQFQPLALLNLLKHPLAACGMAPAACRYLTRLLERHFLRTSHAPKDLPSLLRTIAHASSDHMEAKDRQHIEAMLHYIQKQCHGMLGPSTHAPHHLADWATQHCQAAEALAATTSASGKQRLWHGPEGEQTQIFMQRLRHESPDIPTPSMTEYHALLRAFLHGELFRPSYGTHPRLHILSPMEARLQTYDTLILGSINDDSWPTYTHSPWMNRAMRQSCGLPPEQRRIGQAAHDFITLGCSNEVILTRSIKEQGTLTTPSPFWLKLQTTLASAASSYLSLKPGLPWHAWARHETVKERTFIPIKPPAPCPSVEARPKKLSVTHIEQHLRNPYAIYAKHILRLKPLPPLNQEPDAADFGNWLHKVLEQFAQTLPSPTPGKEETCTHLIQTAQASLETLPLSSGLKMLWSTRLQSVAPWIAEQHLLQMAHHPALWTECRGTWHLSTQDVSLEIHMIADRIEQDAEGTLHILDYKTGALPAKDDVQSGLSAQLILESLIAQEGTLHTDAPATTPPHPATIKELTYWKIGSHPKSCMVKHLQKDWKMDLHTLQAQAKEGLSKLIETFYGAHPAAYLCCPKPTMAPAYNDYAHLARMQEWQHTHTTTHT